MSIQPQELAADIFERLHHCSANPEAVSDFVIRRLEVDAEKLIKENAIAAYTALGCISYLKHDTQAMLDNHQRALRLGENDFHSNINFAVSLCNSGRYVEACQYSQNALNITGGDDVRVLQQNCEHLASSGRFLDAYRYVAKLLVMKIEPRHEDFITAAANLIQEKSLEQELVSDYLCSVTDIMVKNDIYPTGEAFWDYFDDDHHLVREVFVDVEPDKAAQMNLDLSKLVVSKNLPEDILSHFSNSFTVGKLQNKTSESHGYKT